MSTTKIIVLDDDPTGSQTVHSCLLLTRWDVTTLKEGLRDDAPLFFVLTNTRGMDAERATQVTREVCINLKQALDELTAEGNPINPLVVSRSDSTLRGHYPDLAVGDVLIFQEILGPRTGEEEDADPAHRHAVRLTEVRALDGDQPLTDPLPPDDYQAPRLGGDNEAVIGELLGRSAEELAALEAAGIIASKPH